jgi:hypothetical protein
VLVTGLCPVGSASAGVPPAFVLATVKAASVASGQTAPAIVSTQVAELVSEMPMLMTKLKTASTLVLAVWVVGLGVLAGIGPITAGPAPANQQHAVAQVAPRPAENQISADLDLRNLLCYSLPMGAISSCASSGFRRGARRCR